MVTLISEKQARSTLQHYIMMKQKMMMIIDEKNEAQGGAASYSRSHRKLAKKIEDSRI